MLTWEPAVHSLGVAEMDATHEEFIRELVAIQRAEDADFPRLFNELNLHLRVHFDNESRLMRACRFPPLAIHEGEHERVLGEVALIGRAVARGQLGLARLCRGRHGGLVPQPPRHHGWRAGGLPQSATRRRAWAAHASRIPGSSALSQRPGSASRP